MGRINPSLPIAAAGFLLPEQAGLMNDRSQYEARRRASQLWRAWYQTKEWFVIRARQLRREPFCVFCARTGVRTPATICDHIERHRGDRFRFFAGPFQSLCKRCHDSAKQSEEINGYSSAVGADGCPQDPRHPFNRTAIRLGDQS
ncbi:MAG: HNH endonuclease [Mesorhizobium sp.]|nr:MAG: HNH endonuclease [Mesorhizobium sp.]